MDGRKDTVIEAVLEHLIEHGASDNDTLQRDDQVATGATIRMRKRRRRVRRPPWGGHAVVIAAGRAMRVFSLFRRSARARPPRDRSSDEALHEESQYAASLTH